MDLGEGDRCTVQRADSSARAALLRNRSYGSAQGTVTSTQGK